MSYKQVKRNEDGVIRLADKHHMKVTLFQGKAYIHIRHNEKHNKTVSLTLYDLKSLLQKYNEICQRVKILKKKVNAVKEEQDSDQSDDDIEQNDSDDSEEDLRPKKRKFL